MSLNERDQLSLLSDLLTEQSEDCSGSVAECQQIRRLVHSLMVKNSISNQELAQLLPDIYNYGRQGELVQSLEEHIAENQTNLKIWTNSIQQSTIQ